MKIDTSKGNAIKVSLPNGNSLVLKECNYGLYHLNIDNINKDIMHYSCLKMLIKTKHISHAGKLQDQKKLDFYNRKLNGQVTLTSNPLLPII